MSTSERNDALMEANQLGLTFASNIPTIKLQALIAEEKGLPPAVDEEAPASPAMKAEPEPKPEDEATIEEPAKTNTTKAPLTQYQLKRQKIADAKKKAFAKTVVTITNKDPRENDVMTTAYLSFENQFFGLSKVVPLDIPVELENALIGIAEVTMMTLHKDEIKGGKRTGNKIPVRVKKFAISYGKPT